jgi:hypothetical protein
LKIRIRMPCHSLCGYSNRMSRPHFTCLFCRVRRFFYGKMDKNKYHYNSKMRIVMPQDCQTYVLFIDNKRPHAKIKEQVLKRLLTICEWLSN